MKFAISAEQRDYFHEHGEIELEGILTTRQLQQMQQGIHEVFVEEKIPSDRLFMEGRDLWRKNETVKKVVMHTRLAELAGALVDERIVRLGFGQYLPAPDIPMGTVGLTNPYHWLISETKTLAEHCSIQGILCGLILCLKGVEGERTLASPFPTKAGHGVFVGPDFPIDYQQLYQRRGASYLLIVYVRSNAVFICQKEDPHAEAFKKLGYAFGDQLKDRWNPIVLRT